MINARNARFAVYLEPYSLEPGEVGAPIYKPILVSRHRSNLAAYRALIRLITGTDPTAKEYLRAVNNKPRAIALRYVAQDMAAPFNAYSANQVKGMSK